MDWRRELERGCSGKTSYGVKLVHVLAERHRARGRVITAYRCVWCGDWHLGHIPSLARLQAIADAIRARAQDPAA